MTWEWRDERTSCDANPMADFKSYMTILVFLVVGGLFIALLLFLSRVFHRLLHGRNVTQEKLLPYECGEDVVGDTRVKFNIRFYIIALIFLIFDVEIVLMFPWGVVFRDFPARGTAFLEMLVFASILLVGLAYVWAKGDLEWVKTLNQPDATQADSSSVVLTPASDLESD